MTHPHHMHAHAPPLRLVRHVGTIDRCDDLPTAGEWFRLLAGNLALIRTWWAVPMVITHLLVRVADLVHFWRHGQTAVLYPIATGGQDHSARAVLTDRNPMVFGGEFTTGPACITKHRKRAPSVITWQVPRRRVLTRVHVGPRGHVACYDPKVTT